MDGYGYRLVLWRTSTKIILVAAATLFTICGSYVFLSKVPQHQTSPCFRCSDAAASTETSLQNLVFGIAGGSELWNFRKHYIAAWWRPSELRGFVWLDNAITENSSLALPMLKLSEDVALLNYSYSGPKQQLRMARVVSETFRLGLPDVHWFVMGDDDTFFVPENLLKVLSKYDHRKLYYIGSMSESHLQNVRKFSSNMAYGGAGYAISYALAKKLEKSQDRCHQKFWYVWSSDARIQACISEFGVPLTKELGFHQFDIHGDASGLLGAHPLTPLVSLHHIDSIDPIFPGMNRTNALLHLSSAIRIDPQGILQQSICYNMDRRWSIKVSWGYAVQITRGLFSAHDLELPIRTFVGWLGDKDEVGFPFKTWEIPDDPCLKSVMFFMSEVELLVYSNRNHSKTSYLRYSTEKGCAFKDELSHLQIIHVTKQITPNQWFQVPRRPCCNITYLNEEFMQLNLGECVA